MNAYKDVVLLSADEYAELIHPDKTYTLVTKTSAKKIVEKILKDNKVKCWTESDDEDHFCSECPVYCILGFDGGDRICTRQKRWSQ